MVKRRQYVYEARALDVADMKALRHDKRYRHSHPVRRRAANQWFACGGFQNGVVTYDLRKLVEICDGLASGSFLLPRLLGKQIGVLTGLSRPASVAAARVLPTVAGAHGRPTSIPWPDERLAQPR